MAHCRGISFFFAVWIILPLANGFIINPPSVSRNSKTSLSAGSSHIAGEAHSSLSSSAPSSYLATCIPGLAPALAEELEGIHPEITDISQSGNAAVTFTATREASLNVLCWTRTAHRLLELVAATNQEDQLYDKNDIHTFINQEVNVRDLLGDGMGGLLTLSVKAILNNSRQLPKDLSHSHYTALSIKNALCDVVRDMRGDRPDVDIDNPDVPLVAMLRGYNGGASLSLYRSLHPPGSLHKRGYRQGSAIHKAAMKESLAAGLLMEAGWKGRVDAARNGHDKKSNICLIDPMAGSGSLILEAAMMAADISPGLMRIRCQVPGQSSPPVIRWKSELDTTKLWKEILLDASNRAKTGLEWIRSDQTQLVLRANDIHAGAVEILEDSAEAAGLLTLIDVSSMDCFDLQMNEKDASCLVVTNPPWGVRLTEDVTMSWDALRHFLRDVCPDNTEAWVLSGHKAATASLKLKRNKMVPIQTGDQDLRWVQYIISSNQERRKVHKTGKQTLSTSTSGDRGDDSW
ncbi:unnamed protein product [Cylindrotheca closterium]|uniref:Uncharacterized protein n=1 Tax=Cylindrotheca closterium TaxID=2856 RepID=A0AAD2FSC0_9STRA|nr:unnamed protein product [Cylindrotheca closterium]